MNHILITGGAGFVGTNLTEHFLARGDRVTVYDNLWRPGGGAKANLQYLMEKHKGNNRFLFEEADIRDAERLKRSAHGVDRVFHVAAQTAMTTSLDAPVEDFEINALGTLNVLEAIRSASDDAIMVYTSTNKVFGDLTKQAVALKELPTRWDFADPAFADGVDQDYPLDFEGPYGCSKGVGDSYCVDYARTFGIKSVVFRMSGIYGKSQRPTEDQGWVAWLVRRALEVAPITIYGDGKQVRDILYVDDLVRAFVNACEHIDKTRGNVYTIGGGRDNSISLLELLGHLKDDLGIAPSSITFDDWRRADQKVYISDTSKAARDFDWVPEIGKEEGIRRLHDWIKPLIAG